MKHILITWHRPEKIILNEGGKAWYEKLLKKAEKLILKFFPDKENYVFHLGGCEWWDNDIGDVLLKHWYKFELFVPKKDKKWKDYWDTIEFIKYVLLKKYAIKTHIIPWWYMARDRRLAKDCSIMLSYCRDSKSGTFFTIKEFLKNNWREDMLKNEKEFLKGITYLDFSENS